MGGLGNHTSGSPNLLFDPEPSNKSTLLLSASVLTPPTPLHSLRRLSLQVILACISLCPEMGGNSYFTMTLTTFLITADNKAGVILRVC